MLRKTSTLLLSASVVALMATMPAMAENNGSTMAGVPVKANSAKQISADSLIGRNLVNAEGEMIGDINSVIIGGNGKTTAIVVGVGGFLGMGEREVAIDWNDLKIGADQDAIRTNLTKSDLKALPEYKYEKAEYRKTTFRDDKYTELRERSNKETAKKADWIAARDVLVSKLIGANVVNDQMETIGTVEEIVMNNAQPQLILSVGEFLGMGGHKVAVDLSTAKISQQRGDSDDLQVSVAMNKDQLKAMPEFNLDAWKASANKR